MDGGVEAVAVGGRSRKRRTVAEKRQIVALTRDPGASVAAVARTYGVNANQVFAWRRAFDRGELVEGSAASPVFLPATVCGSIEAAKHFGDLTSPQPSVSAGAIHIEFPGRAMICIESGADPALLRLILESLRHD